MLARCIPSSLQLPVCLQGSRRGVALPVAGEAFHNDIPCACIAHWVPARHGLHEGMLSCVAPCLKLVTHIAIGAWPAGLRQSSALVKQGLTIRAQGTKRARTSVQTNAKASPVNGPLSGGSNGNDRLDKLSMDELEVSKHGTHHRSVCICHVGCHAAGLPVHTDKSSAFCLLMHVARVSRMQPVCTHAHPA